MKKRLLILLLTLAAPAAALDVCGFCADVEVGADVLYWKPTHCTWNYATLFFPDQSNPTNVRTFDLKSDYDFGFRVNVALLRNCLYTQASYLWIKTNDDQKARVQPDSVLVISSFTDTLPANTSLAQANARQRFTYQNFDIRLGNYLHRSRGCDFHLFANLRWAEIEKEQLLRGTVEDTGGNALFGGQLERDFRFYGIGLGVGMGGEFCLFQGFNALGEVGLMGLIGNRKVRRHYFLDPLGEATDTTYPTQTTVVPAAQFRLAINYSWCTQCATIIAELGYELDYYWNAINFTNAPTWDRFCEDAGFAGPYAGVQVVF